jgi:hypothetical protein
MGERKRVEVEGREGESERGNKGHIPSLPSENWDMDEQATFTLC